MLFGTFPLYPGDCHGSPAHWLAMTAYSRQTTIYRFAESGRYVYFIIVPVCVDVKAEIVNISEITPGFPRWNDKKDPARNVFVRRARSWLLRSCHRENKKVSKGQTLSFFPIISLSLFFQLFLVFLFLSREAARPFFFLVFSFFSLLPSRHQGSPTVKKETGKKWREFLFLSLFFSPFLFRILLDIFFFRSLSLLKGIEFLGK